MASVWPPQCPLAADSPLRARYAGPFESMPLTVDMCFAQRYEGEGERVLDWSAAAVDALCAAVARYAARERAQQPQPPLLTWILSNEAREGWPLQAAARPGDGQE